tara:strand:- start:10082 stop:11866 length:1785 start_codon:yes stop_codon:yes gene_type:complete
MKVFHSIEYVSFGILIVWLVFCAWNVDVELYDGLDTIVNARNFTGQSSYYVENRAPLMAFLMVPANLIHLMLELDAFDVRPYHFLMAFLHSVYLVLVYWLLIKCFKRDVAVLIAFLSAIPNFIFFSYAPFISHDIFPGLLLLGMLVLADKFYKEPRVWIWMALVTLGTVSALIKHTFALFWILLLFSNAIVLFSRIKDNNNNYNAIKVWLTLAIGGIISGIITWLVLATVLNAEYSDINFLLGPYKQLEFLIQYAGGRTEFPAWVFLRNFPAYGILTVLLLIPGFILSLRLSSLQRTITLVWIFYLLAIQLTGKLEVRYLVVLAPLTAFILVPPIQWLLSKKNGFTSIVLLLSISILPGYTYSITNEARRVTLPFYKSNEARELLAPLYKKDSLRAPILINWRMLSFASPIPSPLAGDRYHRLFHIARHHLVVMMGYSNEQFIFLDYINIPEVSDWPTETAMILVNRPLLINPKSWEGGEPIGKSELMQSTYLADRVLLSKSIDGAFNTQINTSVKFIGKKLNNEPIVLIESYDIVKQFDMGLFLRIEIQSEKKSYPLRIISDDQLEIVGLKNLSEIESGKNITVRGFVLKHVH